MYFLFICFFFFFSSRRRHTRWPRDWSSDVCSSDLFGGRISAELRLWEALDRGLLCPFQYFGIHDDVDLSGVAWRRSRGYEPAALSNVYTGHDARAMKIAQAVVDKVGDPGGMRALGFCVSIEHAEFMAARFNQYG